MGDRGGFSSACRTRANYDPRHIQDVRSSQRDWVESVFEGDEKFQVSTRGGEERKENGAPMEIPNFSVLTSVPLRLGETPLVTRATVILARVRANVRDNLPPTSHEITLHE